MQASFPDPVVDIPTPDAVPAILPDAAPAAAPDPDVAAPDADVTELARDLNALICFIHRRSSSNSFAVAEALDLSLTHCKALSLLDYRAGEVSVKDLAEGLGMSVPAASRTADSLLGRGLVARREDEYDRRVRRIALTPQGREAVIRLQGARVADLEQFALGLSGEERERLADALRFLLTREDIAACRPTIARPPAGFASPVPQSLPGGAR